MKQGSWLQPRHGSKDAFEKDFPTLELSPLEVVCPGCRSGVKLTRKAPTGKVGGWCAKCNRGVAA